MRVVYFTSLFPCWSETFIVREILELIASGVDVRIVSLKPASERLVQSDAQALTSMVVYPPPPLLVAVRAVGQVMRHPIATATTVAQLVAGMWRTPVSLAKSIVVCARTLAMLDLLRDFRPDHLHAHWATYPSTATLLASRHLGVPFSFTSHAHDIFLEDHLLSVKLSEAAFGVTISDFNRRFISSRVGEAAAKKLRVVHCGISPSAFPFTTPSAHNHRVVAVGRLDEIKGFPYLIEACALLRDQGIEFSCRIIGEGPLRGSLQQQIDDAGLQRVVTLVGALPQESVRAELTAAGVFVLPSVVTSAGDRDGIPVALMEAMALGLPVVSTRVSGIPELVEHEHSGHLAEPRSAEQLARCIRSALVDSDSRRRMAENARQKVQAEFNIAIEAQKLLEAMRGSAS